MFKMLEKTRIFELNPNSKTISIYIPKGHYELVIHAGFKVSDVIESDHKVVFIKPKIQAKNLLSNHIVLSTSCEGCNLSKANLKGANLFHVNLH